MDPWLDVRGTFQEVFRIDWLSNILLQEVAYRLDEVIAFDSFSLIACACAPLLVL